ncbi:MAG: superfamily II DNA/RNA helicase, partial [Planctomycetota bacterium]
MRPLDRLNKRAKVRTSHLSPRTNDRPRRSPSGKSAGPSRPKGPEPKPLEPVDEVPDIESFSEWEKLGPEVLGAITAMGITKPTPVQALCIGEALEGRDIIAKAETGTGKTLAFGAPMMARIAADRRSVIGLVLSPTRELAEQVFQVLVKLGEPRGVKCCLVVGGEPMHPQVNALQAGAQVVVGTPGRVLDLLGQGFLKMPWTEFAVLDEADKMLEIGFIDDVRKILEMCGEYRQTMLFSATFPPALLRLARDYTTNPFEIATAKGVATVESIDQNFMQVSDSERPRAVREFLRRSAPDDVFLVFCDRRTDVDKLMRFLERERFSVKALHGGYDQTARFKVMTAFRTGSVKALIATDVASRGLDVLHVTHVVNFNAPRDVSDYTHRIGRTGRAGRTGTAVTLVGGSIDMRRWRELREGTPFEFTELQHPRELFEKSKPEPEPKEEREERPSSSRDSSDREERPSGSERPRDEERPRRSERPRNEERPSRSERP